MPTTAKKQQVDKLSFFDLPADIKNEIPNETGPRPMRGYTATSLEYVSKLLWVARRGHD